MSFFLVGHFEIFFSKKIFSFCFIPIKTCQSLLVSKDFSKFWWLPCFPAPKNTCLKICNTVYINVLSALKKQASLNFSLNSQIKVESVKYTIFDVISPHRKGLDTIGVIWANFNMGLKSVSIGRNKKKRMIFDAFK